MRKVVSGLFISLDGVAESPDQSGGVHDSLHVANGRFQRVQVHLCLKRLAQVQQLPSTRGFCDSWRTDGREQLPERLGKGRLGRVEYGCVPVGARNVEYGKTPAVAQNHQWYCDARIGGIRPCLTQVVTTEEIVLRPFRLDDPKTVAEHRGHEIDLDPRRADHAGWWSQL